MSANLSPRAKAARQLVEDDLVELGGHEGVLFADGFESGDTAGWSATQP